jgi:hypothetical protein
VRTRKPALSLAKYRAFAARDQLTAHDDPALGKVDLLAHLQHLVPAGALHGRQYELRANIALGEASFVHRSARIGRLHVKNQYWHGCEPIAPGAKQRTHNVTGRLRTKNGPAGSFVALDLFDKSFHVAQQRRELPPFGDGLGGVATMPKGVPISLRRARRCAAVHPAAPRRGRLLK